MIWCILQIIDILYVPWYMSQYISNAGSLISSNLQTELLAVEHLREETYVYHELYVRQVMNF